MAFVICYENWNAAKKRSDVADDLINIVLQCGHRVEKAHLNVAGQSKVIRTTIGKVIERTLDLTSSWSIFCYDPAKIVKEATFLVSETCLTLRLYQNFGGFYLCCNESCISEKSFMTIAEIFRKLSDVATHGLGYCTEFPSPNAAVAYSLDIQFISSFSSMAEALQERITWQDTLRINPNEHIPRNIYAVNFWPAYFFDKIKQDKRLYQKLITNCQNLKELGNGSLIFSVDSIKIPILRGYFCNYIFENADTIKIN